ncbi:MULTISPECIES: hypothetical protein [Burkholderia]|nr:MULTISPECIES: hypothetical protein [Burkholderia]
MTTRNPDEQRSSVTSIFFHGYLPACRAEWSACRGRQEGSHRVGSGSFRYGREAFGPDVPWLAGMIRYFLAKGDRGGNAVITEGLEFVTCSSPPPRVQIATLYMKTYCAACKQEGFIAPEGPRLSGTGPNGRQWALSGDVNVCGCSPPPVFYAERGMKMILTSRDAAGAEKKLRMGEIDEREDTAPRSRTAPIYDEQVRACIGTTLSQNYPYLIEMADGRTIAGRVDTNGRLPRIHTEISGSYQVYWGEDALAHEDWPPCQTDRQP